MGLHQGEQNDLQQRVTARFFWPVLLTGVAAGLALFGDTGRDWFSFDRSAIAAGEVWRLLSGHLVHLGVSHLALNLAGLLLVWYLVGAAFSRMQWLIVLVADFVVVNLGLWFLQPQLAWYVGLSGILHGLLAAGILGNLNTRRVDVLILGVALVAKLIYEQLVGPLPGSEESTGGAVIVAAHFYGAIGGAIGAGWIIYTSRPQNAPMEKR
jgi:rhomboid family GlyGly-CTERM serine protease